MRFQGKSRNDINSLRNLRYILQCDIRFACDMFCISVKAAMQNGRNLYHIVLSKTKYIATE